MFAGGGGHGRLPACVFVTDWTKFGPKSKELNRYNKIGTSNMHHAGDYPTVTDEQLARALKLRIVQPKIRLIHQASPSGILNHIRRKKETSSMNPALIAGLLGETLSIGGKWRDLLRCQRHYGKRDVHGRFPEPPTPIRIGGAYPRPAWIAESRPSYRKTRRFCCPTSCLHRR